MFTFKLFKVIILLNPYTLAVEGNFDLCTKLSMCFADSGTITVRIGFDGGPDN